MSMSERQRLQVVVRIKHGDITVGEAARSLDLIERQMYRVLARYKARAMWDSFIDYEVDLLTKDTARRSRHEFCSCGGNSIPLYSYSWRDIHVFAVLDLPLQTI